MAQKKGKKRHVTRRKVKHHTVHHRTNRKARPVVIRIPEKNESKMDRMVMENFVSLQKVLTNLSIKLDDLTTQVSKLLEVFEISAKSLAEKDFDVERDNKELLEKIETLIDQNKTLARGVSLVHERIPRELPQPQMFTQPQQFTQSPPSIPAMPSIPQIPQYPPQKPMMQSRSTEGFQPSIASSFSKRMSKEVSEEEEIETPPTFESPI